MRKLCVILATAGAVALAPATAIAQGRGEFPEQPGDNPRRGGCEAVFNSQSNPISGRAGEVQNERAAEMNQARFIDACVPGA